MANENNTGNVKLPDHKTLSTFGMYRVRVLSQENFQLIQKLLFKLGYAWSDDLQTMSLLRNGVEPLFIYTDFRALMYFGLMGANEHDFIDINSERLAVLWRDKKYGVTVV